MFSERSQGAYICFIQFNPKTMATIDFLDSKGLWSHDVDPGAIIRCAIHEYLGTIIIDDTLKMVEGPYVTYLNHEITICAERRLFEVLDKSGTLLVSTEAPIIYIQVSEKAASKNSYLLIIGKKGG
jgi:hypothetical protein